LNEVLALEARVHLKMRFPVDAQRIDDLSRRDWAPRKAVKRLDRRSLLQLSACQVIAGFYFTLIDEDIANVSAEKL
jgi:hypothetical protein